MYIVRVNFTKSCTLHSAHFYYLNKSFYTIQCYFNKRMKIVQFYFNPITAGVVKKQDTLGVGGGGQFDPPSKSHVLCPNMTNDSSLESSYAFL